MPNQTQASITAASTCWLIQMQGWCSSYHLDEPVGEEAPGEHAEGAAEHRGTEGPQADVVVRVVVLGVTSCHVR